MSLEPIAIIGIGCRYPGAANPDAFWQLLREGRDAVAEVPADRWDSAQFYDPDPSQPGKANTRWGGFLEQIDQFDPQFFGIAPREVSSMDPQQRLMLEVAWEAIEDAGQLPEQLRGSPTGVFVGISTHDYSIRLWQQPVNDPYAATGTGNCIAANRISYVFDLKGPSLAVDTACSSSLVAVHLACQSLWNGESSLALAGGVNVLLLPTVTIGFSKGGFMSAEGRCKSFDASADGYVRSEGAGMVVLKPLAAAIADCDSIYAVIRGSAVNQDGFSSGLAAPNQQAQEAVLREAYRRAGVSPALVQYVEAHGTGTKQGDPIELNALGAVLGEGRSPAEVCAIGSVKTNIGHAETAAGIAGLIKTALALKHRQLPPNLHFRTPNPRIDFAGLGLRVQTRLASWPAGRPVLAGVNSFGFGGTNAHVVLEAAPPEPEQRQTENERSAERPVQMLALSAKSEAALRALAQRYATFLENQPSVALADLCHTANTRRAHFQHRLALVADSAPQLQQQLQAFADRQATARATYRSPTGDPPAVAFLFTGQGSQYVGMGQELYRTHPLFRETIDHCDRLLRPFLDRPLLDLLGLLPSSLSSSLPPSPSLLDQTAYTQPALFALEYALAKLWESWGILPGAVCGHSIGEYVAACIAGVFSLEDALKLVAARGRLMQQLPQTGAMVAAAASEAQLRSLLRFDQTLAIAASNGPQNTVISGRQDAVAAAIAVLEAAAIKATPLAVSHAFHSPLMEPMLGEFAEIAATVSFQPPQLPLVSNVTGAVIAAEMATVDYWCRQIRQPVRFTTGMETLRQHGCRVWLEIGPKPTLLSLGRSCFPDSDWLWLPSLRPGQSEWQSLLQSLSELYSCGLMPNWSGFDQPYDRHVLHLPTYPFQRQRFWWEVAEPFPRSAASTEPLCLDRHPLLGQQLRLAGTPDFYFQAEIAPTSPAYLQDHCLSNQPIFPAAAYAEMAIAAGQTVFPARPFIVEQLAIEHPLLLNGSTTLQLRLSPQSERLCAVEIFSLPTAADAAQFKRHATAKLVAAEPILPVAPDLVKQRQVLAGGAIAPSEHYQRLRSQGLDYGNRFQGVQQLWQGQGQALAAIQLPEAVRSEADRYNLHPVLLDSGLQALAAAIDSPGHAGTYLPVGIDRLYLVDRPAAEGWGWVQVQPASVNGSAAVWKADMQLLNAAGAIVAVLEGVTLHYVGDQSLRQLLPQSPPAIDCGYEVVWRPQPHPAAPESLHRPAGEWLIFADRDGVGEKLAHRLQEQGDRCTLVFAGDGNAQPQLQRYSVDPADSQQVQRLINERVAAGKCCGVIHLWGLQPPLSDGLSLARLQAAQEQGCASVLSLVQAIAESPLPLWLVTRATQAIAALPTPLQVSQSALWGLGRVIRLEYPELRCVCLDLDFNPSTDLDSLLRELRQPDGEDQIAYRQGTRYVARLTPQAAQPPASPLPAGESFRVSLSSYGVLDHLQLVPADRRPPGPGEVEIQVYAAGLNFRDVLNALGLLQQYAEQRGTASASEMPFGGECSGRIVAIGPGVTNFQIGERVMAVPAIGSFSRYVTVNAQFVTALPASLSCIEAATLPTPFLTAAYGLKQLAKLGRGDRVLIHAAAGGVGLAAVQIAQQAGAEVFATASPSKWALLESLGVKQVMNSRSLDFAKEVMQLTQGEGVEVILNSLNGEAIAKNLTCLAKGGRLVEIGKLGIWDQAQIQQIRPDIAYFAFDLLEVAQDNPTVIAALLQDLVLQVEGDRLRPLPHVVFPVEEAAVAFRYMAQAKHSGRIVLTLPRTAQNPTLIRADGSYLITGGLGALGLHLAGWLVERGAKHLILTGRHSASPAAEQTIQQLEQAGAEIVVASADVAQPEEVARLLELCKPRTQTENRKPAANLRKSTKQPPLPPLRGIIHAAGVLDDGMLHSLSWQRFSSVVAPKLAGTWNLHELTQDWPLDFFVCFSSIAALLGSAGQGSYAAANAAMDAIVQYRRRLGLAGLSINWGPWAESGMAARLGDRTQQRWAAQGLTPIAPARGVQILEALLWQATAQVGVFPVDWSIFAKQPGAMPFLEAVLPQAPQPASSQAGFLRQLQTGAEGDQRSLLREHLRTQLAKVLGFGAPELIEPQENFADLGMDSLMAVEFTNRLQASLGYAMSQTLLFDYPSLDALTTFLAQQLLAETEAGVNPAPSPAPKSALQPPAPESLVAPAAAPNGSGPASRSPSVPPSFVPLEQLPPQNAVPENAVPENAVPEPDLEAIPAEYYQFHRAPEYLALQHDLEQIERFGNPFFVTHDGIARENTQINGQALINYASYNYLGLSGDPVVSAAAKAAIDQYGTSVSASRVISGERAIHRDLEQEIADFLGTEACIVYISGHATNMTTIGHLMGESDLILYDALSHNSIRQGCDLSRATAIEFAHNDWRSLEQLLRRHRSQYQKVLITIEGIYSSDGDLAPLPEIVALKKRYKALLLVDEAHSIGVLGQRGRGIGEHFGVSPTEVDLWMGTLSKSFASCGGYIAGSGAIVQYLKYTAPGFVFSVGMSPANAAAALAALQQLKAQPDRVLRLQQRAALFLELARANGLNTGASQDSPVIPVIVGEPHKAVQLTQILLQRGIHVQPMVYPAVPHNAARLRFFISCTHSEAQIRATVAILTEEVASIQARR